jgi:hypothetical protein
MAQRRESKCQKKYLIDEHEHVRVLPESSLERIGLKLNEGLTNGALIWRTVACALGIENDDVAAIGAMPNPGYEALKEWRKKPNSTIRALHQAVKNIDRSDVIAVIEECQLGSRE